MLDADLEVVDGGYQVVSVGDNTAFDLAVGDVITAINDEPIASVDWITLVTPGSDNAATLTVQRDGAETTLEGQLMRFGGRGGQRSGFPGNGQPNGAPDNQQPNGFPGNGQLNGNNGQPGGAPPSGNGQPGDGNFV